MDQEISNAITEEREYQRREYPHGQKHEVGSWILIMQKELDEAKVAWFGNGGTEYCMIEILQVVTVGVAALEEYGVYDAIEYGQRKE